MCVRVCALLVNTSARSTTVRREVASALNFRERSWNSTESATGAAMS